MSIDEPAVFSVQVFPDLRAARQAHVVAQEDSLECQMCSAQEGVLHQGYTIFELKKKLTEAQHLLAINGIISREVPW